MARVVGEGEDCFPSVRDGMPRLVLAHRQGWALRLVRELAGIAADPRTTEGGEARS